MVRSLSAARRGDLITGSVIAVVGVVYFIATFSIERTNDVITPGTFPAIVGIALIVLGAVLVGQSLVRRGTPAEADAPSGAEAESASANGAESAASGAAGDPGVVIEAPPEPKTKPVVIQFALFFVYLAILIPVGFLLATSAFLMALTSIYAPERWIRNLIFSVLFAAGVYFAFVYGLQVYLPVGILG